MFLSLKTCESIIEYINGLVDIEALKNDVEYPYYHNGSKQILSKSLGFKDWDSYKQQIEQTPKENILNFEISDVEFINDIESGGVYAFEKSDDLITCDDVYRMGFQGIRLKNLETNRIFMIFYEIVSKKFVLLECAPIGALNFTFDFDNQTKNVNLSTNTCRKKYSRIRKNTPPNSFYHKITEETYLFRDGFKLPKNIEISHVIWAIAERHNQCCGKFRMTWTFKTKEIPTYLFPDWCSLNKYDNPYDVIQTIVQSISSNSWYICDSENKVLDADKDKPLRADANKQFLNDFLSKENRFDYISNFDNRKARLLNYIHMKRRPSLDEWYEICHMNIYYINLRTMFLAMFYGENEDYIRHVNKTHIPNKKYSSIIPTPEQIAHIVGIDLNSGR